MNPTDGLQSVYSRYTRPPGDSRGTCHAAAWLSAPTPRPSTHTSGDQDSPPSVLRFTPVRMRQGASSRSAVHVASREPSPRECTRMCSFSQ